MEEKNTIQRKMRQTQLVQILDDDLKSQTEKMQDLGQDILQISQKVKATNIYIKEHGILTQQNHKLLSELAHYKKENMDLKTRQTIADSNLLKQESEIKLLQRQLIEEKARNEDYNESIQELTLRVRSETEVTNTQISHLHSQIAHFQAQLSSKDDQIHDLKQELAVQKNNFLEKISQEKHENAQLRRTLDVSNKDISILNSKLEKGDQEILYLKKFKLQYEEERAMSNCVSQNMRDNLELFVKMSQDYDLCLRKLSEMEGRIVKLTKDNNVLRETLVIGKPLVRTTS